MRPIILASLFAIGFAAYAQPQQDDYEEDYGGGGYGGPARPAAAPPAHHQTAVSPAQHHGGDDSQYDVPQEEWKPYSFSYTADDKDGSHSHQQQADSKNRVTGQYSIMMADGRMRIVKYVADENGFRAQIVSNEQGTESKNPADVTIQSSAPTGEEASRQYGAGYSNSRYDKYSQAPQVGQSHHDSQAGYGHGSQDNYSNQGSTYSNTQQSSYSSGSSYNHDTTYSSNQIPPANVPSPAAQAHSYTPQQHTQTYSQHSSYQSSHSSEPQYDNQYSQPAPASYSQSSSQSSSGGYSNDVSDLEDFEDRGYYSGVGSKGAKAAVHHERPSYG